MSELIRDLVIWLRQGWVYTVWVFFVFVLSVEPASGLEELSYGANSKVFALRCVPWLCFVHLWSSLYFSYLFYSFLCISRLSQSLLVKTVKCQRSFAETFTFSDCCKHSWTRWTSGLEDECNSCDQTTGRAFCDGKTLFLQWNGITRDNLMHGTTVWPPKTKELLPAKCKDETIHGGLLKPFQNCSLWAFFGSTAKQSSRNLLLHAVTCCYADRSMIEAW